MKTTKTQALCFLFSSVAVAAVPLSSCTYLVVQECQVDSECTATQQCNTGAGRCEAAPLPSTTVESGFQVETHAMAFPNFPGEDAASLMTAPLLQRMHGRQAMCTTSAGDCRLRPAAAEYLAVVNAALAGGRGEGFSILSALLFDGALSSAALGASGAHGMLLDGNPAVQEELAYWAASQYQRDVAPTTLVLDGEGVVRFLNREFAKAQHGMFRLGLVRVGSNGMLAGGLSLMPVSVTPAETEGRFVIKVYDSNHPGGARDLLVDVTAGTWEYQSSSDATNLDALYRGDAANQNRLFVSEALPRVGLHPAAFGQEMSADVTQVFGSGNLNLLATNADGLRAGEVGGVLLADIPGSTVLPTFGAFSPTQRSSLQLLVPGEATTLSVRANGTGGVDPMVVRAFHPGGFHKVSGMVVRDGQEATVAIAAGGALSLVPAAPGAATLVAGRSMPDGRDVTVKVLVPAAGILERVQLSLAASNGDPTLSLVAATEQLFQVDVTFTAENGESTFSGMVRVFPGGSTTLRAETWLASASMTADTDSNGDGQVETSEVIANLVNPAP
jgi:hypothetical protein